MFIQDHMHVPTSRAVKHSMLPPLKVCLCVCVYRGHSDTHGDNLGDCYHREETRNL